jgi:hypothetical protein
MLRGRPAGRRGRVGPARLVSIIPGLLAALIATCPAMADDGAEAALAAVEQKLLDAGQIGVSFDIKAVGVVQAALSGSATIGPGNDARIIARGEFAGAPADITLSADRDTMRGGNGDTRFEADTGTALREGLIVGLVRMGLLHNLAMLSGGEPPDRIDGTVRDWVTYSNVTVKPDALAGGIATRRFQFTVVIDGQPAAIADLWVDAETDLPLRRVQVVNFADGELRVLEQYSGFSADPAG